MTFATGRYAKAICDRCGQSGPYQGMVEDGEIPGMRVHPECRDPKHPQTDPIVDFDDPIALPFSRPDRKEYLTPVTVTINAVSTGATYQSAIAYEGALAWSDSAARLLNLPPHVRNQTFLRTAIKDRNAILATHITVTVNKPTTVYVFMATANTPLPDWISTWDLDGFTQWKLNMGSPVYWNIYKRTYPAGQIILGGNSQSPAGNGCLINYIPFFVPANG